MALKRLKWLKYLFVNRVEAETEQQYWNEKRKKHLANEHSEGLVLGLEVLATDPASLSVRVNAGRAIDTDGNDPEVESVQQLDLTALVPPSGETLVYLSLRFGSTETDPYFVDEIGATQNKFVQDGFLLEASPVAPTSPVLELCRIRLGAGATAILDPADPANPGLNEIDRTHVKRSGKEVVLLRDLSDVSDAEADAFNAMPSPSAANRVSVLSDLAPIQAQQAALEAEIVASRGSKPSLDERLDVALNEDGTLRTTGFGAGIDREEIAMLRPHEASPVSDQVMVEPGRFTKSDASGFVDLPAPLSSASFPPVAAGQARYDLLLLDDAGALQIVPGTEVPAPGDPFVDHPALPTDRLAVAIVRVDETASVLVEAADITDVREFFNKGGGALGSPQMSTSLAAAGQVVFLTTFSYTPGQNQLLVFSGGVYMTSGQDYTETSPTAIAFASGRIQDERVTIWKSGGGTGGGGGPPPPVEDYVTHERSGMETDYAGASTLRVTAGVCFVGLRSKQVRKTAATDLDVTLAGNYVSGAPGPSRHVHALVRDDGTVKLTTDPPLWADRDGTTSGRLQYRQIGADLWRYLGCRRLDGSGNLIPFRTVGGRFLLYLQHTNVLSGGTATSPTPLSLAAPVPPTSRMALLHVKSSQGVDPDEAYVRPSGGPGNGNRILYNSGTNQGIQMWCATDTSQAIDYRRGASGFMDIDVDGFLEDLD